MLSAANVANTRINTDVTTREVGNAMRGTNSSGHGPNTEEDVLTQALRSFNENEILNLIKNGISGRTDPSRSTSLSCLKAFTSNLKALFGDDAPDNLPTDGNMSTALSPLVQQGWARNEQIIQPKVDGKVLSSQSHNGSDYNDGIHFTGQIQNNILETITRESGYQNIGVFAVGLGAQYHSTILVVVKNPKFTIQDGGRTFQGSETNPLYIFVEDSYGALFGDANTINSTMNKFITGARAYYRGNLCPGGKCFPTPDKNMNLGTWIYSLYHKL